MFLLKLSLLAEKQSCHNKQVVICRINFLSSSQLQLKKGLWLFIETNGRCGSCTQYLQLVWMERLCEKLVIPYL